MGFFNSFRVWEGGPTLYMKHNRTSASTDYTIITIILAFLTVFLAFVTILPGLRKQRISSLCIVTLSLLSGLTILLGKYGSCWHIGQGEITSAYRAFSKERINAKMGISIGLHHMNVTLQVMPKDGRSMDVNFNEKFVWNEPTDMRDQYRSALVKGLPYPILTVAEYFSMNTEYFRWGFNYRSAGYYANIALTAAFVAWILMNLMLVNIPRYGGYLMGLTGALLCSSAAIYCILMPSRPLLIRFEDTIISFHFGWCFWMVLVIGLLQLIVGLVISLLDLIFPHSFSTVLEVDFDTPFNRHIIIQDSEDTGKRARALKFPNVQQSIRQRLTTGSRYIRRLSTKKAPSGSGRSVPAGFYNQGFEISPTAKKHSNASNNLLLSGDVPEISIEIHQDEDIVNNDTNNTVKFPATTNIDTNKPVNFPDTTNIDAFNTDEKNGRKISSESAVSEASDSSGVSSGSAVSRRSLSSNSSSTASLEEVEDTLSKHNDDSESEYSDSDKEEIDMVIKMNQTDERGQIITRNSQNDRGTLHNTWQEELILDTEDIWWV